MWNTPQCHTQCHTCSVVFAKFSLSLHAVADVSVHLIPVASIQQLVRRRGCLVDEDMHPKASWHASAEKAVDECAQICWSETWMCQRQILWTDADLRWWSPVCLGEEGPRWQSTPPWCALCTAMARQDGELPRRWHGIPGRTQEEGHIPRAPWPTSTGATRGFCC